MCSGIPRAVVVVLMALLVPACATAPPKKTGLMTQVEGIDVTKRELQSLLYAYAAHFAGQVELASGEIHSSTSDPAIRRAAIEWNIYSTPEMMQACFNHDPLVGMLGAWSFTIQVREFFTTGNGRNAFGPHQDVAVSASIQLEEQFYELVSSVWSHGDFEEYERIVRQWATENLLKNMRFVRVIHNTSMNKAMGASVAGGLGAAGAMNEQMVALTDRANILTPYLPRQMYWQTALLMEDSKQLIAEARDSTLVAVRQEVFGHLDPVFAFADSQRSLVVMDLARERGAVLAAIADERNAVLVTLAQERTAIFAAISEQRDATMRDINAMSLETLERLAARSEGAITNSVDHIVTRAVQVLAIPIAIGTILLVVALVWVRNLVNRVLDRQRVA